MGTAIGVLATGNICVGVVEDNHLAGPVGIYPEPGSGEANLKILPAEEAARCLGEQILQAARGVAVKAVGVGFPGIIRDGEVLESPNLPQMKGFDLAASLAARLEASGLSVPVRLLNDADAIAAGIASTRGQTERLVRVWFLSEGVGFGRYPRAETPGEGGHMVVTLDPKERFCGCGGTGHLEGIMGQRAIRLRFLDREPEEVFTAARSGDARCAEFLRLWHRALAAASATVIHLEGPGRFYVAGLNAGFADPGLLHLYLHDLVKMSPLQGSAFEILPTSNDLAIIGAAVSAQS